MVYAICKKKFKLNIIYTILHFGKAFFRNFEGENIIVEIFQNKLF